MLLFVKVCKSFYLSVSIVFPNFSQFSLNIEESLIHVFFIYRFRDACQEEFPLVSENINPCTCTSTQGNVLFTLNCTTHSSVLLLCVVQFNVNKTLYLQCKKNWKYIERTSSILTSGPFIHPSHLSIAYSLLAGFG